MGNIELVRNYFVHVCSDGSYALMKRQRTEYKSGKRPKPGKEKEFREKAVGYYSTLSGAVLGCRRHIGVETLSQNDYESLGNAIDALAEIDKEIRKCIIDSKMDIDTTLFI